MRVGDTVGQRFVLDRLAGEGGMGSVYRATDQRTGQPVAVKLLARDGDALLQRFLQEAGVHARLDHPAIVRYLAHGASPGGEPYLAMDWLEGQDLAGRLAAGPLSVEDTLALGSRIAGALAHAHAAGVVHRDVKPANVFLVGGDPARATLLDFGIARTASSLSRTRTGSSLGTPGYMSPEQARGERSVDARADVFALGCVLYECLTAEPAFSGAHVVAVLAKILLDEAPRVSASVEVPNALDDLVARMLSKAPSERPADGRAALDALERIAHGSREGALSMASAGIAPSGRAVGLGLVERRVLSIALAKAEPESADPLGMTVAQGEPDGFRRDLAGAFGAYRAVIERLADGSLLAVWTGEGAATDHAARAARCVLAVAAAVPGARLALATGKAMANGTLAMGEVIDRAAALADRPRPPGAANLPRIDDATAGLVEARFEVDPRPEGLVLVRERDAQVAARTLLGRPTPFVGREQELSALVRSLDEATEEPASRAICVTAPAGAGKSRLALEFVRAAKERGAEVLVATAEALASGSAFAVAGRLVRAAAGLFENEPARAAQQKLRARVSASVAPADALRVAEFLGEIAGAPRPLAEASPELRAARQDSRTMGDQMRRAWVDWLAAESRARPLVLILEDLHWGDAPSVELLDGALDELPDAPLLVLALARPEVDEALPRVFARRGALRIDLRPLPRRASERLVREVLGGAIAPELAARLSERAAGNAFYLEELIRAVAEGQGDALPDSVLAMLHARLGALDPGDRRVLRAASVFGERFWPDALRALLGGMGTDGVTAALGELSARELVQRRAGSSIAGEDEYAFRHALVRDAAYELLTPDDRALAHRLAGAWLEARGAAEPIALAEHFERGGEPARAVRWYIEAARGALEGNDLAAAIERAERGVAAGAAGADRGALRLLQAEARRWSGTSLPAAERDALEALALLPRATTPWFSAVGEIAALRGALGDRERMAILGEALAELSRAGGDEAGDPFRIAVARMAAQLQILGRFALGDQLLAAVEASAPEATRPPLVAGWIGWARLLRELMRGNPWVAVGHARAATAAFDSVGVQRLAAMLTGFGGTALVYLGAPREAAVILGATMATLAKLGVHQMVAMLNASLAEALLDAGDVPAARRVATEAADANARMGDWLLEGRARDILARSLVTDDPTASEREARRAVELLAPAPPFHQLALGTLAEARLALGDADGALAASGEALGGLCASDPRAFAAGRVRLARARALLAAGCDVEARRVAGEARARILAVAEAIDDPARREGWLGGLATHRALLAWPAASSDAELAREQS